MKPSTESNNRLRIIIDTDTANEVDDLFAVVRAVKEPTFEVLGISSSQFRTSPQASNRSVDESQKINEELLELLGRTDIPHPLGSNDPLPDQNTPSPSAASKLMVQEAHKTPTNQKLNLVVLGACTNVASAILEDPTIVPKISVHYIGFWHTVATNHYDKKEFNTDNDPLAVELLLNTEGLDFNVMTASTCQHLVFEKLDVDAHLKGKGSLADYLVDRWESYTRWWTDEDPEKKRWIMWDVAIIEALAHPEFSQKTPMKTPPENTQRFIGIHTSIKVDAMIADFWNSINY